MLFDANNEPYAIHENSDRIQGDEAMEPMTWDAGDAFIENLNGGDSGDNGVGDDGSGFNLGRFLLITFIVLSAAIFIGYCIFSAHQAARYRKLDALEPHSRTYAEFVEVFNELMEPQGISIDAEPMWRPPVINQGLTAISVMTLPDGSQALCGIMLRGLSVRKNHIMHFTVVLSKEQAAYMEPIVRGMYAVFTPAVKQQEDEDLADVLTACQDAFILQTPYETEKYFIRETAFSLLADDSDYVTLWWRIEASDAWWRSGMPKLPYISPY